MKLEILGTGCPKCKKLFENTEAAVKALGITAQVEKITDLRTIAAFNVMVTPALAVDGKVRLAGKVASVREIIALLQ